MVKKLVNNSPHNNIFTSKSDTSLLEAVLVSTVTGTSKLVVSINNITKTDPFYRYQNKPLS